MIRDRRPLESPSLVGYSGNRRTAGQRVASFPFPPTSTPAYFAGVSTTELRQWSAGGRVSQARNAFFLQPAVYEADLGASSPSSKRWVTLAACGTSSRHRLSCLVLDGLDQAIAPR